MGYTGFTLVMPFLPLFIGQLGVTDPGQIAMWTGVSLGITPAMTAILAPAWGRLGDRFGRKIMVERSLVSFVILFAAMAYVSRAWQVLAIRAVQGLFAGYGSLSVAMAAESAPRDRMPSAIGLVQTAQRIGPGLRRFVMPVSHRYLPLGRAWPRTAQRRHIEVIPMRMPPYFEVKCGERHRLVMCQLRRLAHDAEHRHAGDPGAEVEVHQPVEACGVDRAIIGKRRRRNDVDAVGGGIEQGHEVSVMAGHQARSAVFIA